MYCCHSRIELGVLVPGQAGHEPQGDELFQVMNFSRGVAHGFYTSVFVGMCPLCEVSMGVAEGGLRVLR